MGHSRLGAVGTGEERMQVSRQVWQWHTQAWWWPPGAAVENRATEIEGSLAVNSEKNCK